MSKNKNINLKKKLQAHLLKENQHKSKAKIGKNMQFMWKFWNFSQMKRYEKKTE